LREGDSLSELYLFALWKKESVISLAAQQNVAAAKPRAGVNGMPATVGSRGLRLNVEPLARRATDRQT
jgi:hypothetical protein